MQVFSPIFPFVSQLKCFVYTSHTTSIFSIAGLGGMFIKNPLWTDLFDKSLITAHPLGGCRMGETGAEGVVNHQGKVFQGMVRK